MGAGQANSGQASTAANQNSAANQQNLALSNQYGTQEQQTFNTLFGNGTPGSSGTLTGMMNPNSLNTGTPTGAYQTAWNNTQNQIAQNYAGQKGSLAQGWANSGIGANNSPSGFQANQQRQLANSEADARGSAYTGIVGQQHSDALNNFWNANNIAAGGQGSATSGSTSAATGAGSASSSLYGTAGQYHPSQGLQVLQSGIQAAGSAAGCPAEGSKVRMADYSRKPVEELKKGDKLQGVDGKPDELIDDPQSSVQEICEVYTNDGRARVSLTHAFIRQAGGYTIAARSVGETIETEHGARVIAEVRMTGERLICFHIFLKRCHGFEADGFWGLE